MAELEHVPPEEAAQIENITRLTVEQLKRRYPDEELVLRGVHAKDHGCVTAKFKVLDGLAEHLRVGVFEEPGREYEAWVRFSNAAVLVTPDSPEENGVATHGSRGMAVKLLGVEGSPLVPTHGPLTQDFLMVNQSVFAFANVEDYEVVSRILQEDNDQLKRFFAERIRKKPDGAPDLADPATRRALRTLSIVRQVQSTSATGPTPPAFQFQAPPGSPLDNRYFSAAPFLFGDDRVMKFAAKPVCPADGAPDLTDQHYLRAALLRRLTAPGAEGVVFEFQVQLRCADDLAGKVDAEVEDASFEWAEGQHPFETVATITIPPQDFDSPERRERCERLIFTPWHGVAEHRPLGGINRLRRTVYEVSAAFRHLPKEPARL